MSNRIALPKLVLMALGLALCASACSNKDDELRSYIDRIKARTGDPPAELPKPEPPPTFEYVADERRSPFMPEQPQNARNAPDSVLGPDPNRPKEYLEAEPLDSLRMKGTLNSQALVQSADGRVHRVSVGNYLGQNYGRIVSITETEIRLLEIVPGGGGYVERPASIVLSDD